MYVSFFGIHRLIHAKDVAQFFFFSPMMSPGISCSVSFNSFCPDSVEVITVQIIKRRIQGNEQMYTTDRSNDQVTKRKKNGSGDGSRSNAEASAAVMLALYSQ